MASMTAAGPAAKRPPQMALGDGLAGGAFGGASRSGSLVTAGSSFRTEV